MSILALVDSGMIFFLQSTHLIADAEDKKIRLPRKDTAV